MSDAVHGAIFTVQVLLMVTLYWETREYRLLKGQL